MLTLSPQNIYFPLAKGRYQVSPGLRRLGTDFGQGDSDGQVFQFDERFCRYHAVKVAGHQEDPEKYYPGHEAQPELLREVLRFMVARLCQESPTLFTCHRSGGIHRLTCHLTGETLDFDRNFSLREAKGTGVACRDSLDALALQIQEDLALLQVDANGRDRVVALHLSFPNFWSAAEKIGKDFIHIHKPVPGMDYANRSAPQLLNAMIHKGPFVRFAWGLTTDDRLNHHPENEPAVMAGRTFDPARPELWLRVERQVMVGFPEQQAALFTIRTYLYEVADIARVPERRDALLSALRSMSAETRKYKGLARSMPEILAWLSGK